MSSPEPQLTPMMAQYRRIKGELPKDARRTLSTFSRTAWPRTPRRFYRVVPDICDEEE